MGDLIRGETFRAGETVTAERLHRHVEEALIKDGAVQTSHLADGSVTEEKLAADVEIQAGSVKLTANMLLVGNDTNVGQGYPAAATFEVKPTFKIKDAGIVTALLADANVTTGKLADAAVTPAKMPVIAGLPATAQGAADKVPVITVNDRGLVTALTTATVTGVIGLWQELDTFPIPGPRGIKVFEIPDNAEALDPPDLATVWLRCMEDDPVTYRVAGDRVPLWEVNQGHAFSVTMRKTEVVVVRSHVATNLKIYLLIGGSIGEQRDISEDKWKLQFTVRFTVKPPA